MSENLQMYFMLTGIIVNFLFIAYLVYVIFQSIIKIPFKKIYLFIFENLQRKYRVNYLFVNEYGVICGRGYVFVYGITGSHAKSRYRKHVRVNPYHKDKHYKFTKVTRVD